MMLITYHHRVSASALATVAVRDGKLETSTLRSSRPVVRFAVCTTYRRIRFGLLSESSLCRHCPIRIIQLVQMIILFCPLWKPIHGQMPGGTILTRQQSLLYIKTVSRVASPIQIHIALSTLTAEFARLHDDVSNNVAMSVNCVKLGAWTRIR